MGEEEAPQGTPASSRDGSAVAPGGPTARQLPAGRPRRLRAATRELRASCSALPTCYFLFIILAVSTIFHCHRRLSLVPQPWASSARVLLVPGHMPREGMFTVHAVGRLGNQMGQYATLYALAKMHGRPAYIPARMHRTLAPLFRISLPVLHPDAERAVPWRNYRLDDWMQERYRHIAGRYVRLTGYPCSWTFYHHLRPEILREFSLHEHVRRGAQAFLRGLRVGAARPRTFVGVHVRRGDYVHVMPRVWRGVVADRGYLEQAPVFVVTSDGMAWCRDNIDASRGDVVFAGNGAEGSPGRDFALLTQCNHTVMTIGTFGIWAAYLAGGDTVYLANYTLPDSPFLRVFKPEAAFLPDWVGIAANL